MLGSGNHGIKFNITRKFTLQFQVTVTSTLQIFLKVKKRANIRIRYNQAPHLTQDTNGKVKTSQLDITNESNEVSPTQLKGTTDKHISDCKVRMVHVNF